MHPITHSINLKYCMPFQCSVCQGPSSFVLQLHFVMMSKNSKFGVHTFNTFWIMSYIKVFAWRWQQSSDHNSSTFSAKTDQLKNRTTKERAKLSQVKLSQVKLSQVKLSQVKQSQENIKKLQVKIGGWQRNRSKCM